MLDISMLSCIQNVEWCFTSCETMMECVRVSESKRERNKCKFLRILRTMTLRHQSSFFVHEMCILLLMMIGVRLIVSGEGPGSVGSQCKLVKCERAFMNI